MWDFANFHKVTYNTKKKSMFSRKIRFRRDVLIFFSFEKLAPPTNSVENQTQIIAQHRMLIGTKLRKRQVVNTNLLKIFWSIDLRRLILHTT